MSVCQDCEKKLEWGRGFGGSVCPQCRAARANKARRDREKASGRRNGARKAGDW